MKHRAPSYPPLSRGRRGFGGDGAITLAHGGRLFRSFSPDELKEMLIDGPSPLSASNGRAALAGS